jgi:hypothetical protein
MPIYILFIIEYPFFTSAAYRVMDIWIEGLSDFFHPPRLFNREKILK